MPDYPNFTTNETINTKNVKDKLVEYYIQSLGENKLPWERGWVDTQRAYNPVTGAKYHGNNYVLLQFISMIKEYDDPRWCTIKQANQQGWKIKPKPEEVKKNGEIYGVPLKYWLPCEINKQGKFEKWISWDEYNQWKLDTEDKRTLDVRSKTFYVYNAKEIEGIPELEIPAQNEEINPAPFIDDLIKNMGVGYHEGGNQAFYNVATDSVIVPRKEQFLTEYDYHSTRLHELCHATGHNSRLNRDQQGTFGSQKYAKEELRAEIASSFLSQDIKLPFSEEHLKNHAAYIQSWIEVLKKDPDELFRAIKSADEIEKYVLKVGDWERYQELSLNAKKLDGIELDGYYGTWHLVAQSDRNGETYYMFEHDEYGDQTAYVITDKELSPVTETMDDINLALDEQFEEVEQEV